MPGLRLAVLAGAWASVALAVLAAPAITRAERPLAATPFPTATASPAPAPIPPEAATATPSPSYGSALSQSSASFLPAGASTTATASVTPSRPASRLPATTLSALWPLMPTAAAATPQPSAFFVPRLITVTAGFGDFTGARLQGRVLDWRGNGMAAVAVRALSERDDRSTLTRSDGTYLLEAVPAGTYTVSVGGYEGIPAAPLPVDGQSIFIVEFIEGSRPVTPTGVATATVGQRVATPSAEARATASPTPLAAGSLSRTPTSDGSRPTPAAKQEASLLSGGDIDYLTRTWLTPFLLGAAGGYMIFLIGMFGARLRR